MTKICHPSSYHIKCTVSHWLLTLYFPSRTQNMLNVLRRQRQNIGKVTDKAPSLVRKNSETALCCLAIIYNYDGTKEQQKSRDISQYPEYKRMDYIYSMYRDICNKITLKSYRILNILPAFLKIIFLVIILLDKE